MKYAIVIPDGCADEPQAALSGKTPLQAARTPAMDEIARLGVVGRSNNVPAHLPAGSDVANLSLFGYDPNKYFTGRAPLEAAAQGIKLAANDWAIRCNLVTIIDGIMKDHSAGGITNAEARRLIGDLSRAMNLPGFEFHYGVSYRNLMVYCESDRRQTGMSAPPRIEFDVQRRRQVGSAYKGEVQISAKGSSLQGRGILQGGSEFTVAVPPPEAAK